MENVILTPYIYGKMILMNLGRNTHVCQNMSHAVTDEFRNKNNPVGATVSVRKPYRYQVKKGLKYQPQPLVDTATPVTVSQVAQIGWEWDSIQKTLSVRQGSPMSDNQIKALNNLYAGPAATSISSTINAEAATYIANRTWNSVGTPGAAPTSQTTFINAGDLLVAQGLPEEEQDNLTLIINRRMSSAYINGTVTNFNPQQVVSEQTKSGEIVKRLFGYKIAMDQTINRHTVGTYAGTPLANQAAAQTGTGGNNGTMSVITDGWSSGASNLTVGDVLTFGSATSATVGGVNSLHPVTKIDTGYQQQFTVLTAISDTTGAMTISVAPAATPTSVDAQYANVTGGIVDNAIITVVGSTGAVGDQGLLIHPQAFAFVSVPLDTPDEGEGVTSFQVTDPDTGVSLRLIKAFDWDNSRHINRVDCLYDFAPLYPEMGTKLQSS